jgi:HK97 family phage prohead protease
MMGFITFVLRPWCVRVEQSIRRNLLTPVERLTHSAEFGLEGLLRGDSAARSAFYSQMTQNGIMTRDDAAASKTCPSWVATPTSSLSSPTCCPSTHSASTPAARPRKTPCAPGSASPPRTPNHEPQTRTVPEVQDFHFEIKAVEKDGFFSGYGSVFGVLDSYREIVAPGAFTTSLAERSAKGRKLPILWQHRSDQPLGTYELVKEDSTGLYLEGRLLVNDVVQAREAHALVKAGAVTGLSIGYYVQADVYDEKERIRTLTKLALEETSLVTFPANDAARVESVKSRLARGDQLTLNEFEGLLREAGFSKSQATAIAGRGYKYLLERSESDPPGAPSLLKSLQTFRLLP